MIKYLVLIDSSVYGTFDDYSTAYQEASRIHGVFAKKGQTVYLKDSNGNTLTSMAKTW